MNALEISNLKLTHLISYLDTLETRVNLEDLGDLLKDLDIQLADVKDFLRFKESCYNRVSLKSSRWYDLLVICWKPGQNSGIHDHGGSSCGFKILNGEAWESVFQNVPSSDGQAMARKSGERSYTPGSLCLAEDNDIHRIENRSETENLVTLHIYSPALQMNSYEEARNENIE